MFAENCLQSLCCKNENFKLLGKDLIKDLIISKLGHSLVLHDWVYLKAKSTLPSESLTFMHSQTVFKEYEKLNWHTVYAFFSKSYVYGGGNKEAINFLMFYDNF